MKGQTTEKTWLYLDDHYLRALRSPWYRALVEIEDVISSSTVKFFSSRGLKSLHLPITTHSISSPMGLGSDSQPVEISLFGVNTYLADSMQFMLEYGCRLTDLGCYYLMPSFRGENADSTHLNQFYHSEAEIVGGLNDVISLVEAYVRFLSAEMLHQCGSIIQSVTGTVSHIEAVANSHNPFPQITMEEAQILVGDAITVHTVGDRTFRTIGRQGERRLIEEFDGFVWLKNPDHLAVPFYQAFADPERKRAQAADLLFGLGETVGAGERHSTPDDLLRSLEMHRVDRSPYEWYYRLRELFPMRTSGFGLGTERYICWLLQHNDVRDCQLLPRFNGVAVVP